MEVERPATGREPRLPPPSRSPPRSPARSLSRGVCQGVGVEYPTVTSTCSSSVVGRLQFSAFTTRSREASSRAWVPRPVSSLPPWVGAHPDTSSAPRQEYDPVHQTLLGQRTSNKRVRVSPAAPWVKYSSGSISLPVEAERLERSLEPLHLLVAAGCDGSDACNLAR